MNFFRYKSLYYFILFAIFPIFPLKVHTYMKILKFNKCILLLQFYVKNCEITKVLISSKIKACIISRHEQ